MKKKILIAACVVLAILLIPIPSYLKDGGTVEYNAILYQVEVLHSFRPFSEQPDDYITGTIVTVLGWEIYNDVE